MLFTEGFENNAYKNKERNVPVQKVVLGQQLPLIPCAALTAPGDAAPLLHPPTPTVLRLETGTTAAVHPTSQDALTL